MAPPLIPVVAGAILDPSGRVLLSRRPDHSHQGGLWEFPGGKLAPGEGAEAGLARELAEELGVHLEASEPLIRVPHDYGDRRILLEVRRVLRYGGIPRGREGQPLRWAHPDALDPAELPAADRPVVLALRLPDLYLITGPDPHEPESFIGRLERALAGGVRLVQLRAPGLDARQFGDLAIRAHGVCAAQGARLLLNTAPELAVPLPRDGLHLSAARLATLQRRPEGEGLVGASCHCAGELARAEALGLDYALLSPVCATASHPAAQPLGWGRFAELVEGVALPVFALGGLAPGDLATAKGYGAQGIAAIRGLWPDGPPVPASAGLQCGRGPCSGSVSSQD